jgi:hypothetical protein
LAKYAFPVPDALEQDLEDSFLLGPMLTDGGVRSLNEEQIARIGKLSVQVQSDEHPPPHFHIRYAGENASFAIIDGKRLPGVKGLERFEKNIRVWWQNNKCELIAAWNRLRPADCPVGPVAVPTECLPPPKDPGDK